MTTTTPTPADEQHRLDCLAAYILKLPAGRREAHLARMVPALRQDIRDRMLAIYCLRLVDLSQPERLVRMQRLQQMGHGNRQHQVFYQQVSERVEQLLASQTTEGAYHAGA